MLLRRNNCGSRDATPINPHRLKPAPLAPPLQRHRAFERVRHGRACLLRGEVRCLQLKIPAGLPVGVIDQHHARLDFQAWLLPLDHILILRDKSLSEKFLLSTGGFFPNFEIKRTFKVLG